MNKPPLNKQERVLRALSDSAMLLVEPGFPVERRTIFGVCGDDSDLALSLEWRDAGGCEWVADFTEESLASALVTHNQIALKDSESATVRVAFYNHNPGKF